MRFANPAGLWLGLLAIPVLALHVLRPRRPAVEVGSTFLWREVAQPVSVAAPWQRLRPSALLALQLLAVALLAAAVAQPVRTTRAALAEHTVFIVDASGSMSATDGRPDRLEAARDRARSLRRQLPGGGIASVVVADAQPRVVLSASSDRAAFDQAVDAIRPTAGAADFATAFTLAESVETPGAPVGFVLLSDGGLTDAERGMLPPGTDYQRTGSRSTNRAITRLAVEPRGSGLHARVTLRNTGGAAATQGLRLDVDGRTAHRERVDLPAGATLEREVDLPGGDRVEAFLEGEDLLAADNHAFAVAGRRRTLRVLHAGPENIYLDRLLAALPSLQVERSEVSRPAPGFDLAIYDGVAVPTDPGAPYLAIAPPGGAPGVAVTGEVERPAVVLVRTNDPVLSGIDLSEVGVARAQRIEAPGDEVLVGAEGTALLVRGRRSARPFAYLGFSLADSNLPVQVAFPLLADRLVTALAGAALPPTNVVVGQPLPVNTAAGLTIDGPGGVTLTLPAGAAPPVTDRAGFWTVRAGAGRPEVTLAVNADPAESALAPVGSLPVPVRPLAPGERRPAGELPQLRWVVAALLAVLAAEGWLSWRRRGVPRRQWRVAVGARLAVAGLLLASLSGVALHRRGSDVAVMFLVDGSDSLGPAGRAAAVEWAREALAAQPRGARAGVAFFGGDARLELTVQEDTELLQPATTVDASRTNLAGALRLAGAVLPSDARRRIVVVSDGRANQGDAATEARRLRDDGIQVDVHAVEMAGGPDVAVTRVDAPGTVRQGEAFTVRATIEATRAQSVRLTWQRNGQTVEDRAADVPAGRSVVELAQTAPEAGGLASYRLDIDSAANAVAENDVGFAAVQVEGPARVLLVEGMPGEGAVLAAALRAGGLPVDVVAPAGIPGLDRLATYSSTVLVDVDARSLAAAQVQALGAATRDLGRGLVTVGGDRSYALGGYLGSELEKLLPVTSDVKDPKRRSSVAEVLAIDSSGSMGACHCSDTGANGLAGGNRADGGVNKTDISRAAAARTIAALAADDQVGVLAFNTQQRWIVPLQTLPAEEVVTTGLRQLHPAGGTNLTLPLKEAGDALKAANARLKHIILFTDGFTSVGGLDTLVEQAAGLAAQGITVSVVATGETGARENLSAVAEAGRGRFYNEQDLNDVPQVMMQEALLASRRIVNEETRYPEVVSLAQPVRDLAATPPLLGWLGTTTKPSAQTALQIGDDRDPLLASWQLGLGRATSWTSDASARWSQQWAGWAGYTAFWSAVVKDTFPAAGASGAGVRAEVAEGRLRVTAESAAPWPDGATAVARVAGPGGTSQELALERTSATTFAGELPAAAAGAYGVGAVVVGAGATQLSASTVAVQSYSAEYVPGTADPGLLARVSELSGGRGAIEAGAAFDRAGLPAGRSRIPLAGWMLLGAALLWPVAVGLSRVALHGAGAAALRTGGRRLSAAVTSLLPARPGRERPAPAPPAETRTRAPAPPAAPPPTLERLLRKKRGEE